MSADQVTLVGLVVAGIAGLWAVYGLLSNRIEQRARDLNEVRANYVRRDDFLRVVDRFEAKVDQLLKALGSRSS